MIVNESSNTKKIEDATAISKEIGYNEIAYINNSEKIIGEMPIEYNNTQAISLNNYSAENSIISWSFPAAYGNGKCVLTTIFPACSVLDTTTGEYYQIEAPDGWSGGMFNDIAFGNGTFVWVGGDYREIYVSSDGINWERTFIATAESAHGTGAIIYDKNKKLFGLATTNGWWGRFDYYISSNGRDWELVSTIEGDTRDQEISKLFDKNGAAYYVDENKNIIDIYGTIIGTIPYYTIYSAAGKGISQYGTTLYTSYDNYETWNQVQIEEIRGKELISFVYHNGIGLASFMDSNYENSIILITNDMINWKVVQNTPTTLATFCDCEDYVIGFDFITDDNMYGRAYVSYDLINWKNEIITENYKLKNTDSGMFVTIPEQTVERRIIKEEHNNTPYIRFEDETLIFPSFEEVEENTLSNHPEGSYYVVYEDLITFGFYILAIGDYEYFTVPYGTTWGQFIESQQSGFDFSITSGTYEVTLRDVDDPNFVMPNTTTTSRAIKSHLYTVIDENNNICYKDDIITAQKYGLMY